MNRKAYIITYDAVTLFKGFNPLELHNFVTTAEDIVSWWHYMKGTYIIVVDGGISAAGVSVAIHPFMGTNPYLVMEVDMKNHNGMLPAESWHWINQYMYDT